MARALQWLSQREHSSAELRRKLLQAARRQRAGERLPTTSTSMSAMARGPAPAASRSVADGVAGRADVDAGSSADALGSYVADDAATGTEEARAVEAGDLLAEVDAVIAWLREHDWLSDTRFVESRLHVRASGQGMLRIRRELAQHGLSLPDASAAALRDTELERASILWHRRFGDSPATTAAEQSRRCRFLERRGFTGETVAKVMRTYPSAVGTGASPTRIRGTRQAVGDLQDPLDAQD